MASDARSSAHNPAVDLAFDELLAMNVRLRPHGLHPGTRPPVGQRAGRQRNQGMDLAGLRAYVAGDDIRHIDWRATARSGRTQLREYVSDAHLAILLAVDLSPSMYFGTKSRLMAKTAALAAARLAWQSLRLNEPVGLAVLPDGPIRPPRHGRAWLLQILERLHEAYQSGLRSSADPASREERAVATMETASAHLARGDGIIWIADHPSVEPALFEEMLTLGQRFDTLAVHAEDQLTRAPLAPGRYPLHPGGARTDSDKSLIASLDRRSAMQFAESCETRRKAVRARFLDAGWRVEDADILLPAAA
ncbi:MAG: DUF58 domain-containing protein [Geminicoccaceae bacterium]